MSSFSASANAAVALAEGFFAMQTHRANANQLQGTARQRELEGVSEALDRTRAGRAAVATGVTIAGASGFTSSGSATDVLARMAQEAEVSAARARFEASRDADLMRYRAKVERRQASMSMIGGIIKAGASFI